MKYCFLIFEIAFGVANFIKLDNPAIRLGIFACGICPGGGLSNIYSYLLGGDVSLSITMTCISTVAALGELANQWCSLVFYINWDVCRDRTLVVSSNPVRG